MSRQSRSRSQSRSRMWGTLLLGALLLGGWAANSGAAAQPGSVANAAAASAAGDAATLLQAAERLYPSAAYAVTLQHAGAYRRANGDAAFGRLGDAVAAAFGLPLAEPSRDANGHRVYVAAGETDAAAGGKLEAALVGWADGATHLTVRWDAPAGTDAERAGAWTREAEARLRKLGVDAAWTATVRGSVGKLEPDVARALQSYVRERFEAEAVETYADAGSEIVSYASPLLRDGVRVADGRVNLQAALHRDSVDGTYRLTMATPLIASEP
ncbi:YwmB family TATA-box binding protein [Paenibacillus flagellatus]|uniref:TATA-box binding protein n=1 Tax=Paenibacillus flagellatus TaxID=2211139 RepID=A0A2V5JVB2_9BACL|nr:YwmB family TATA-box binding protein [Paenibacillus flagellatus]PYI50508.1 hypothetical protein DLM86_28825 [Paenibacillus flagellatus]